MRRKVRIVNFGPEGDVAVEVIRRTKAGKSIKRVPGDREVYLIAPNSLIDFELGEHDRLQIDPTEETRK